MRQPLTYTEDSDLSSCCSHHQTCHSVEPFGDEESPEISLVLLVGGFFVTSFLGIITC